MVSSEGRLVEATSSPLTVETVAAGLKSAGLEEGQTVLVHTSLSALGWVVGGPVAVIEALLSVLGASGTLVMPAHSAENSEPSHWVNPPVPKEWWQKIRDWMPAFDPDRTPTRGMGRVAELFRSWPGTLRSSHPTTSFAALGPHAPVITRGHEPEGELDDRSPLGRLYELDAHVLLLGVGFDSNTSLHLAEARAHYRGKRWEETGSAVIEGGVRKWIEYRRLAGDSDDFPALGREFEASGCVRVSTVGLATLRFMRVRPLVDFGVRWLEENRTGSPGQDD